MTKLEYVARSLSKGNKKVYETYVINAIYQKIDNPELEIETQKGVKSTNGDHFDLDLYLPQFKIAVEVDEGYHDSDYQKAKDGQRENAIVESSVNDSVAGLIKFYRIKAYGVTLEELNSEIDAFVSIVKRKIDERSSPLSWPFGKERYDQIKQRGKILTSDTFDSNVDVINIVYRKNYKGWQKAGYDRLWFPVISEFKKGSLTSRRSWVNYFDASRDVIFEKSYNPDYQKSKKEESIRFKDSGETRYVFVKEKSPFGTGHQMRFAGIFVADGWDELEEAERWRKVSTELPIPIKE